MRWLEKLFQIVLWCLVALMGLYIVQRGFLAGEETGFFREKMLPLLAGGLRDMAVEVYGPGLRYDPAEDEATEGGVSGGENGVSGGENGAKAEESAAPGGGDHVSGGEEDAPGGGENAPGGGTDASGGGDHVSGGGENAAGTGDHVPGGGEDAQGGENDASGGGENAAGGGDHASDEGADPPDAGDDSVTEGAESDAVTGDAGADAVTEGAEPDAVTGDTGADAGIEGTESDAVTEEAQAGESGTGTGSTEAEDEAESFLAQEAALLQNSDYLLNRFFSLDPSAGVDETLMNYSQLTGTDLSIEKDVSKPQILIYHTHSQEAFADSVEGDVSTTIVGAGEYLAQLLRNTYGYHVIHDTGVYDMIDGVLDRSAAYDLAGEAVSRILEENPSIEVVIDLHRDGVPEHRFVTEINGKPTAQIMFFNGLSRTARNGPVEYLPNPYIRENLAFSFQLQLLAAARYPELTRPIYLQSLRYNLHFRPRSLLIEAGTQLNTVEEEYNAMEPLAELLNQVLQPE